MAERFFSATASGPPGEILTLEGDEAHHLGRVRRIPVGATVEVFDGKGYATQALVAELGKARATLTRVGNPLPERAPRLQLTLATAVPKGERFDWLVEKATELGVERLIPLRTDRSVVDPGKSKVERLRRAVIEASKQCGRNTLMAIEEPRSWDALIAGSPPGVRLMAHPGASPIGSIGRPGSPCLLAVGPEGGFTDAELEAAEACGWRRVSLGPTILRIETAAVAAAATLIAIAEAD